MTSNPAASPKRNRDVLNVDSQVAAGSAPERRLTDLSGPLLVALLAGDESQTRKTLIQAREWGADFALLSRDVIGPALAHVGEMWMRGDLSIAEEHLATALISRSIALMAAPLPSPPPGAPRILFSCLAGEFHELGVRIASEVAREAGWDAENLGGNVPREPLLRFVMQRRPQAVGLSLSLSGHIPEAAKTIDGLRQYCPDIKIIAGGRVFQEDPSLVPLLGADAVPADMVAMRRWLMENRPECRCKEVLPHVPAPSKGLPDAFLKKLRQSEPH